MHSKIKSRRNPGRFVSQQVQDRTSITCDELESRRLFSSFAVAPLYALDASVGRTVQSAPVLDSAGNLFALTSAGGLNADGSVFELPAGQHLATVVHSFTTLTDPSTSYGNLVIDSSNNIYGTSYAGGTNRTGSIFEIPSGGSYDTLYNFPAAPGIGSVLLSELTLYAAPTAPGAAPSLDFFGASSMGGDSNAGTVYQVTDGASPAGQSLVGFPANYGVIGSGVTRDDVGDIFGTSTSGGTDNAGTIWEVPAGGGLFFSRASFTGTDGSDPLGPLLWDSHAGVFYGTTRSGGANNDGTIFEFSNGIITTLASFGGVDGQDPQGNLVEDSAGDLFGTTVLGGLGNMGSVFELPAGANTIVSLASFDGLHNGSAPIGGLTSDGLGDYYGVTSTGGANNDGVVYEITPAPPTQLAFVAPPSQAVTGQPIPSLTVDVEDASGSVVSGDNSPVTLSLASGTPGSLTGTLTVNAVHGVATFTNAILATSGVYTIAATDGLLTGTVSNSITTTLPADHLVVATQPQSAATGAVIPSVVIGVENSNKDLVESDSSTVTLSIASGPAGGTITGTATVQAVDGLATFSNLSFSQGGTYTLSAGDGTLTAAISSPFVISPPTPHLVFAQQPANLTAGVKGAAPILINLLAADETQEITARPTAVTLLVVQPNGKVAKLGGVARAGVLAFKPFTFKLAGVYSLQAIAKGFTTENSDPFTVAGSTARKLVITTSPPLTTAPNTPFAVQAKLVDAYGNIATGDTSVVTAAFATKQKIAILSGTLSVAAIDGQVTFDDLSIDQPGKNYVLRLLDGKMQTTSRHFTVK